MKTKIAGFMGNVKQDPNIITFSFVCYMGSAFGQTFFIGLFAGNIQESFSLSHGEFGTLYSIATLLSALIILWSARGIDKIPLKLWVVAIFSTLAFACILMANSYHIAILFIAIFLLRQAGQGLAGDIAFVTLSRYLTKGKGQAVAIVNLGLPMAETLFPVITVLLVTSIGWRNSWMVGASFLILIWIPLCLFLLRKHHIRHDKYLQSMIDADAEKDAPQNHAIQKDTAKKHYTVKQMLKDYRFYLLLPILTLASFFTTGIFFHQVHIAAERPWSLLQWAAIFPIYSILNIISAFIFGHLVDKKGSVKLLFALPILYGASAAMLAFSGSIVTAIFALIFLGLGAGCSINMHGLLWAELYGTKYLGAIRSVAIFIVVLASACSPIMFGLLFDAGVSVTQMMLGMMVYMAIVFAISLIIPKLYK